MCLNVSGPLSQVPHCHHGQYHKPGPGQSTQDIMHYSVDRIVSFKDIQIWTSGISLIFAIYLLICEIVLASVCANHSIKVFSMNSWGILVNV